MSPQPRCLLLDAMGTLLTFEPPAPRLRAALRARTGADVGEAAAARAIRAEIVHYRAHLHLGADPAGLAELRRTAAEAMRPELPDPAAGLPGEELVATLLEALRFRAYPEVPSTLRELRRRGYRLVVVSNWDVSLHERLAELGLAPLLDGAVASAAGLDPRVLETVALDRNAAGALAEPLGGFVLASLGIAAAAVATASSSPSSRARRRGRGPSRGRARPGGSRRPR
jgi:FMN phosphatase YigB (HAD superfamily)